MTRPTTTYQWDHESRLVRTVTDIDSNGGAGYRTVDYRYDSFGRRIFQNERYSYSPSGNATKETLTSYSHKESDVAFEYNINKEIIRAWTYSPADNSVLAFDDSTSAGNSTIWAFADAAGTIRSYATVSNTGQWDVLHRQFSATGELEPFLGDGSANQSLIDAPVVWNRMMLDSISSLYFSTTGVVYDPLNGRSLVDRGGANGYVMFGNAPTDTEKGIDWASLEPDEPFFVKWAGVGHTVLDLGGMIPLFGIVFDGMNAAWYAAEGNMKMAALSGVAMIPGLGQAATAAKLTKAAGKLGKAARGVATAGKVAQSGLAAHGVYDGVKNGSMLQVGLSSLGLSGLTGRALRSAGRGALIGASKMSGSSSRVSGWSSRVLDCTAGTASDGRMTRGLRKMLGECFVAGTPVATGVGYHSYYAGAPMVASDENEWSGAWVVAGIATLASAQLLGDERRQRRRRDKSWLPQFAGLPTADLEPTEPETPILDVEDLDFDEVCEELMMGAGCK